MFLAHTEDQPCGVFGRLHLHPKADVTNMISHRRLNPQQCQMAFTHSFLNLLYLWLKPLLIFHAYEVESIPHPSLLQFYVFLAEATKNIKYIKDFETAIVRKEAALHWHSPLAKQEWCCFHCSPSSWRLSALVRLVFKCFSLLLSFLSPPPFSVPSNSFYELCSAVP